MSDDKEATAEQINEILVIEDSDNDRRLIKRALRKCGAVGSVSSVSDGAEALDYLLGLKSFAGRDTRYMPDMVLLDLNIPTIDGLGVLETLRGNARTRGIPIAILTSSDRDTDVTDSYVLGADCFLHKEVDFTRFCETIRHILPQWREIIRRSSPGGHPQERSP